MKQPNVLILYYSFTNQTSRLVTRFTDGLASAGVDAQIEKLRPAEKIPFPFRSTLMMMRYMVTSFLRCRVALKPPEKLDDYDWDYIVLAGPTWSYNPSGPVLELIDWKGGELFKDRHILPVISCRAYWRTHYYCLKNRIEACGGTVREPLIFLHPTREPWKTIGLVLQLLGKLPVEKGSWFRKRYAQYGHARDQFDRAEEEGRLLAEQLLS